MANSFISDATAGFIQAVQAVDTADALLHLMQQTLKSFGVRYFTLYEFTGSTEKGALGNYPSEWGARYAEPRYEYRDPVAQKLFREQQGIFWEEQNLREQGVLRGQNARVFHEGAEFGLKQGYAHLICDLQGFSALTSFCSDRVERDPKMLPAMHLISIYMYSKYRQLTAVTPQAGVPYLTPRQRECLQWVAAGKSDWDIASIMNIGQSTVHTHIESAKRSLGVASRVQAVMVAHRFGLISDAPQF